MKEEDIKLSDWQRILIGEAPIEFMLEVLFRTVVIYIALLLVLRIMGKRMTGQLSISEMAVMITLGAIISVPMQMPDRGIIQGLVVLLCALVFHQGLNLLEFKYPKLERITQGKETMLVKDGVIQVKKMEKNKISRQQLYSALRNKEIYNLGEVRRVYIEACGLFSVYTFNERRPGLAIVPEKDGKLQEQQQGSLIQAFVCQNCGQVIEEKDKHAACTNCCNVNWIQAIK